MNDEIINDRSRISKSFRELRKLGWFARQSFWCCQTCGCAAVPKEYKDKFVFYHKQDAESIKSGNIEGEMYLTHGEGGDGHEVVTILKKHGIKAKWDGDNDKRIELKHKEI